MCCVCLFSEYNFPLYINGSLLTKPWDDVFEIPLRHLQLGKYNCWIVVCFVMISWLWFETAGGIIGHGEFGVVRKAAMQSLNKQNRAIRFEDVAVKTQLPNMGVEDFKNLLREVKITSHVGSHDCIVCFIGASTQNIKNRKWMHVMGRY